MRVLKIVTSPRGRQSVSTAIVDTVFFEYQKKISGFGAVDTLDVWSESLPDFDAEAIGAKHKNVSRGDDTIGKSYMGKDWKTGITIPKRRPHRT
jgi:FMN-dependent NADH-azoreductase